MNSFWRETGYNSNLTAVKTSVPQKEITNPPISPQRPVTCGITSQTTDVLHKLDIAHFHSFSDEVFKNKWAAVVTGSVFRLLLSLQRILRSELQVPLMYFQLQASVPSRVQLNFDFFFFKFKI